jgi:hypothetical protein
MMAAPPVSTLQKKLGPVLQPGESFLASVELENHTNYGAALALIPGGVAVHAVQQTRRKRAAEAAQTIASRLSMDARVLGLTDRRLAIIKWDVFRPKLDSWIALPEIRAASVERKRIETGALVLEFVDGSVIQRESTRRKQLIEFADAVNALLASMNANGCAPQAPTSPGGGPIGLYGWTVPASPWSK